MPVIAFCIDGAIHIVAGEGTRKARNLAADGRCVSATSSTTLPSLDIVVEGRANPLSDGDAVRHIAEVLSASGWPLEANGDKVYGPNAPTAVHDLPDRPVEWCSASPAFTGWISSIRQVCRDRRAGTSATADLDRGSRQRLG